MMQWYPGHMAKAKRKIKENLKKIDIVIETLDARIPASSRNPQIDNLIQDRTHIIVLNKIDLAVPEITESWKKYYENEGKKVVLIDSRRRQGISRLLDILEGQISRKKKFKKALKVMVLGITNVGKSALINALAGKSKAKMGSKPGVTRGEQWIKVSKNIFLMDTPGILWPDLEDEEISYKLALTGAVREKVFDKELAAYKLVEYLINISPEKLENQYNINLKELHPYEVVKLIGKRRGCLISGGKVDRNRASKIILSDFRDGKFGRISLERP